MSELIDAWNKVVGMFVGENAYPWQISVGVAMLIPGYIFCFKVLWKKEVGLKRRITQAKEKGHMVSATIAKDDEIRLARNRSRRTHTNGISEYYSAKYTYVVNGKQYTRKFSADPRHHTHSPLRMYINVYWDEDPQKAFWEQGSDALGSWYEIFSMLFPWILAFVVIFLLGGADAVKEYQARMK